MHIGWILKNNSVNRTSLWAALQAATVTPLSTQEQQ